MLDDLRKPRGLTKTALMKLARVSDATLRRAENDPEAIKDSTWQMLIEGLASAAPLQKAERDRVAALLGWDEQRVHNISLSATHTEPPADQRRTLKSRILEALETAEAANAGEQLVTIAEQFASALPKPVTDDRPLAERLGITKQSDD